MIVIGIGTGRSGTASLAKLLNAQKDAICFHEMNPSCIRFSGTLKPVLNTIDEFQTIIGGGDPGMATVDLSRRVAAQAYDRLRLMPRVRLIGDIAFYYLTYVERIIEHNPNVRFICLRRDRTETVESWLRQSSISRWRSKRIADRIASLITREPYYEAHNYWMEHDGTRWRNDPVWDKCFPKFPGPTRRQAIEQYWDFYYHEAEKVADKYPDNIIVFPAESLSLPEHQRYLLEYCGIDHEDMVFTDAHIHRSRAFLEQA